jgi:phosphatidate cytidylyltransferase
MLSKEIYYSSTVLLVSYVGIFEFFKATQIVKNKFLLFLGNLICFFVIFFCNKTLKIALFTVFLCVGVILFYFIFINNAKFKDIFLVIFGNIYIPYMLSYIISTRKIEVLGKYFVWFIFLGAFSTDIFAYFGGKFFGKHKLIPKISPNKTIEGAIIGIIGNIFVFGVFGFLLKKIFNISLNLLLVFIMGFLTALAAESGDIVASIIKRKHKIKDFGSILPGHGGILDRLDSLIFVAPIVYFFLIHTKIMR